MATQRYVATVGGKERAIELEKLGNSRWNVRIDGGEARVVDAAALPSGVFHLVDGTASHDVRTSFDGDTVTAAIGDGAITVELVDERKKKLAGTKSGGASSGPSLLKSPMPGKVVKVLAPVGAVVTEGQGVIVIEAMKMENELRAPRAGTVTQVLVSEGQTVEGKAPLLAIG